MTVKVKFQSDGGDLSKETKKQEENFDRLRAAERRARTEAQQLNQLVKTGAKASSNATEEFRRKMDLLNRAVTEGKIDQREYQQALKAVNSEFRKGQLEAAGLSKEVVAGVGAFAGFTSAQSILSTIGQLFVEIKERAIEAADASLSAITEIGQLAQISSSPEDFQNLIGQVRAGQQAGLSRGEAARLAFAVDSTGTDKDLINEIASSGLVQTDGLITLAGSIDKLSNNFEGIGSDRLITAKGFAAAAPTEANIQAIAKGASATASSANAAGISGDETLAAISTLSQKLPSPDIAATRLRAFLNKATKLGIAGDSIEELVAGTQEALQKSGKAGAEFLGDEAFEGFSNLQQSGDIFSKVLADIKAATEADVATKLGVAEVDPNTEAALNRRRAEGRREVARESLATRENQLQAILAQRETVDRATGGSDFAIGTDLFLRGLGERLGFEQKLPGQDTILAFEARIKTLEGEQKAKAEKELAIFQELLDEFKEMRKNGFRSQRVALPGGSNQ